MDGIGPTSVLPTIGDSPESLVAQLRSGGPGSAERVGNDFEGLFMSLVLKEMRQTLEPGTLFGGDTSDIYGGLFDMILGKQLVQSGGFGIAKMVKNSVDRWGSR